MTTRDDTSTSSSTDKPRTAAVGAARHLFLAGDIGGTNTRLALYDRENCSSPDNHCRSRYKRPLFVKEYRNEDSLGASNRSSNGDIETSDESESSCNSNVRNFVQTVIAPFLEQALKFGVVVNDPSNSSSSWKNVSIFSCLGIAGPVDFSRNNGTVTTSQRSYLVGLNGRGILEVCRANANHETQAVKSCVVINDFVAQGYGCLSLSSQTELHPLYGNSNKNKSHIATGPKFCIGAGTGLGTCYMVPTTTAMTTIDAGENDSSTEYTCFPSEYGQSDWAPHTVASASPPSSNSAESAKDEGCDDLVSLWNCLQEKNKGDKSGDNDLHIAVEHVVSGTGLATAYECFSDLFPGLGSESVRAKFNAESDFRGRVVGEHLLDCVICKRAVEAVVRAYGSAVGSCAMSFLPTDGLYVTGGLLLNLLEEESSRGGLSDSKSGTKSRKSGNSDEQTNMLLLSSERSLLLSLFLESYRSKGAASFLLNDIPLYLVLAKDTGLRGAAIRAEMEFKRYHSAMVGQQ